MHTCRTFGSPPFTALHSRALSLTHEQERTGTVGANFCHDCSIVFQPFYYFGVRDQKGCCRQTSHTKPLVLRKKDRSWHHRYKDPFLYGIVCRLRVCLTRSRCMKVQASLQVKRHISLR